eukprot:2146033-Prymnesium_polylepis.1
MQPRQRAPQRRRAAVWRTTRSRHRSLLRRTAMAKSLARSAYLPRRGSLPPQARQRAALERRPMEAEPKRTSSTCTERGCGPRASANTTGRLAGLPAISGVLGIFVRDSCREGCREREQDVSALVAGLRSLLTHVRVLMRHSRRSDTLRERRGG